MPPTKARVVEMPAIAAPTTAKAAPVAKMAAPTATRARAPRA
jgi:hypothetical protein